MTVPFSMRRNYYAGLTLALLEALKTGQAALLPVSAQSVISYQSPPMSNPVPRSNLSFPGRLPETLAQLRFTRPAALGGATAPGSQSCPVGKLDALLQLINDNIVQKKFASENDKQQAIAQMRQSLNCLGATQLFAARNAYMTLIPHVDEWKTGLSDPGRAGGVHRDALRELMVRLLKFSGPFNQADAVRSYERCVVDLAEHTRIGFEPCRSPSCTAADLASFRAGLLGRDQAPACLMTPGFLDTVEKIQRLAENQPAPTANNLIKTILLADYNPSIPAGGTGSSLMESANSAKAAVTSVLGYVQRDPVLAPIYTEALRAVEAEAWANKVAYSPTSAYSLILGSRTGSPSLGVSQPPGAVMPQTQPVPPLPTNLKASLMAAISSTLDTLLVPSAPPPSPRAGTNSSLPTV